MKKLNVLILEDDTIISLYITKVIKNLSCNTFSATNYHDASNIAVNNHIDLLIADIKIIGEEDGIDTAKILQRTYKTQVVFLTANIDDETLKRASEVDSLGYLVKPFRENELTSIVKIVIEKHKNQPKELKLSDEYMYLLDENKIYHNSKLIELTKNETKLMFILVNSMNRIVPYDYINEILWFNKPVSSSNRRQLIYKLKQKVPHLLISVEKDLGLKLEIS